MSAFKKYPCSVYDHIYDEELGDADSGIAPDTEITVLTKETVDYYSRPILSHGFRKLDIEQTIIMKTFTQLEQKSIYVISGAEVITIDRQQQRRDNHA